MKDKNAVLESASRELEMLARVIRDRDIESFDGLTHEVMDDTYCTVSYIYVNVDLCAVREILDREVSADYNINPRVC